MDVATFEQLRSDEGRRLLAEIGDRGGSDLALATRLRRNHSSALVAAAMTQLELRSRARIKFGADAAAMYFTPDALEQATRGGVAAHRAGRVARSGARTAVDLGCGIGGDLVALARAGLAVTGIEDDPVRAAMAGANLAALGLSGSVSVGDATGVDLGSFDVAVADPARRDGGGRVFDPDRSSPPWSFVTALLAGDAVVKAAPGLRHALVPDGVEAEWVSDGGDLVEAALWGGRLAETRRRATVLPAGVSLTEADDPGATTVAPPGGYLFEPDPAVIRAGLVTAAAALVGGWLVDPHIAYVSSDGAVSSPFVRAYAIEEELPYREKQLRAALRGRGVGPLTIKKRGVDVVPEQLRTRLRLRGDVPATIVLTRVAGSGRAYLVTPLNGGGSRG